MKILLVDDNQAVRETLCEFMTDLGHDVISMPDGEAALQELGKAAFHLVFSDIQMPRLGGIDLLRAIKADADFKETVVVLFTGHGAVKDAVEAMRQGAYDYLLKPINVKEVASLLARIQEYLALKEENIKLTRQFDEAVQSATRQVSHELSAARLALAREVGVADIGIFSEALKNVFEKAAKLHENPDIPVLIEGETGTGKELVARYIHFGRGEVTTPFVPLNCAALTASLFESELFGYEPGAFTGGNPKGQIGKLESAADGTLFLDEITEMPVEHQAKLLRVIQEREFYRVGGLKKQNARARFICATNQEVKKRVEDGGFRQDLYFRLNVGHIRIPPLRQRPKEILPLAHQFLNRLYEERKTRFQNFSDEAQDLMIRYPWPGNVRELKNVMERIALYHEGERIQAQHLAFLNTDYSPDGRSPDVGPVSPADPLPETGIDLNDWILNLVEKALARHQGNQTRTAAYLGISVRVLHTYLKRLNERASL